jgi:putative phosphoribosyl transferase
MPLPFADRAEAGADMAARLDERFHASLRVPQGTVIVALTRGGVPVGAAIARTLSLPMDILVVRKLGVPWQPELAFGAIASGDFRHVNHDMVTLCGLEPALIESVVDRENAELQRREQLYRRHLPPCGWQGRVVVLVDDGMATGATMQVAVAAARARSPREIIVAVPVSAADALARLQSDGCKVMSLHVPEPFGSVGQWYAQFPQVSDQDVIDCLDSMERRVTPYLRTVAPQSPVLP